MKFEWDVNKELINLRKHHISFHEASSVFYDENALVKEDPDHSAERFLILGLSTAANMLVVSHCFRKSESVIRIISARKATRSEAKQ